MTDTYDPDNWKARTLLGLIDAAVQGRRDIDQAGKEIESYDKGSEPDMNLSVGKDAYFGGRCYKTQQYKREMAPRIYNPRAVPKFEAYVAEHVDHRMDPQRHMLARFRGEASEDYLNYSVKQCPFSANIREWIHDSFVAYGVLWIGVNPLNSSAVSAEHDSWKKTFLDPDATKLRDCGYIVRERNRPRHWLREVYPEATRQINELNGGTKPSDKENLYHDSAVQEIKFYEIYLKRSLANYKSSQHALKQARGDGDMPRKYVIAETGEILWEGEWETPYYLDPSGDGWPCVILGYYPGGESPYPLSPLYTGLPWQRALNWMVVSFLCKFRWSNRDIIAILEDDSHAVIPDEDKEALLEGDDPVAVVRMVCKAMGQAEPEELDIRRFVQRINLATNTSEAMAVIDWAEQKFAEETGLHGIFVTGQPDKQDRSAAATRHRESNLATRLNDMRGIFDDGMREVGRKMWLTLAYHMDGNKAVRAIGTETGPYWGQLVQPEHNTEEHWKEVVRGAVQGEAPELAGDDEFVTGIARESMAKAVTLSDWADETDITIEGGSVRRRTPEEEDAMAERLANQYPSVLAEMGAPEQGMQLFANMMERMGQSPEIREGIIERGKQLQQVIDAKNELELAHLRMQIQALQAQAQQAQAQAQAGVEAPGGHGAGQQRGAPAASSGPQAPT